MKSVAALSGLGALGVSLVAALAITPSMRWLAWRTGFLAPYNAVVGEERPPVAYLGGIAIFLACAASGWTLQASGWNVPGLHQKLLAALPLTLVGLADDAWVLEPWIKATLQTVCAVVGLSLLGSAHSNLELFADTLVMVTIVNAVNFLDASDGLAAAVVAASLIAIAGFMSLDVVALLALLGAVAGFLVFNHPPASIYLGDAGSHFLGAMVALEIVCRFMSLDTPTASKALAAVLVVAVPIFDMLFTVCLRILKNRRWWIGSRDHVVFRIRASGRSKASAALILFVIQLCLGALGAAVLTMGPVGIPVAICVLAVTATTGSIWLSRFDAC